MDIYYVDFEPVLSDRYQFIYEPSPGPASATRTRGWNVHGSICAGTAGCQAAVSRLSEFRAYAASMNQRCDLPLGPTGTTGTYDACPVWMLAGFIGGVTPPADATQVFPLDNPFSALVLSEWQNAVAVRRIDPARVRRALELIPLWLND